jgi:phosphoglycerate dehydrogenase-like enzyme
MVIVILSDLKQKHLEKIKSVLPGGRCITAENIKEVDDRVLQEMEVLAAWGFSGEVTPEMLAKSPNLKWLHVLSAGIERLPFDDLINRGILVTNSRGIHGIPIAEHVFAFILSFVRGFNILIRQQIGRKWKKNKTQEVWGKTLGIIGAGSIGTEIAKRGKAFGMEVIAVKRNPEPVEGIDRVYPPEDLKRVLSMSDFVVLSVPLTKETYHMIGEKELAAMKPSAYLINISRGDVIDEQALIKVLREGRIAGAGLDVFSTEPLPEDSPLYGMENVIITPHNAALSPMYITRAMEIFTFNLKAYKEGAPMKNIVDLRRGY